MALDQSDNPAPTSAISGALSKTATSIPIRESNGGAEAADAGSDHQGASGAVHGGVFRHTDLVQLCSRNGVNRWVV